ncbi:putative Aspartic peptidase domain-containing protein [Seiridium cardinale]
MVGLRSFAFVAVWSALLIGIVTAFPAALDPGPMNKRTKTASVSAADGIFKGRHHGPIEYHRTLSKYNIPIPHDLQRAVDRYLQKLPTDQTGGVPALSQNGDLEWIAPANIGTPAQQIYLDFDTGSADTWVFTNDTASKSVKGQTILDLSKSTTAQLISNCTWSIMYGDFSSSSGIVYQDTLSLGDLVIEGMTIESAKQVSQQFSEQKEMSGLFGLAFSSIIQTKPKQKALLDFLPDLLEEPIFTSDLRHNSSDGSYNFGYIDHDLHGSEIEYTGVDTTDGFWAVDMKGFAAKDDLDYSYEFASPVQVILDTGSTLFYAPEAAVQAYYKNHVPYANFSYVEYGWILPCNSTPPNFIWELTDKEDNVIQGEVPGEYLPYAVLDSKGSPPGYCYSGLQSLGGFSPLQGILGDIFLKSSFQVWDVGQERVGFATKPLPPLRSDQGSTDGKKAPGAYGRRGLMEKKTKKVILQ